MSNKQDTPPPATQSNPFTQGRLPLVFARTAIPIIFVMSMNGLFTVVDAYFVGEFIGARALAAVTLMFPFFMLMVALGTLVASGMASELARALGAKKLDYARQAFVGAHALSMAIYGVLLAGFLTFGMEIVRWICNGSTPLIEMAYAYISITLIFSPLMFLTSVYFDALRCEGKMGIMTMLSATSIFLNILFNYILIVELDWGVAGSAWGTVFAQATAIVAAIALRAWAPSELQLKKLQWRYWRTGWPTFLALGAPQSLSFLGISIGSGAVFYSLQIYATDLYSETVSAYGIITRIMSFTFLPLLGLNLAFQTVTGNNTGAKLWQRADDSVRLALLSAFVYCVTVQGLIYVFRHDIGAIFVDDQTTIDLTARIMPIQTSAYFLFGPALVVSQYFQALGDAKRATFLSLTRPYVLTIPLTLSLPLLYGEPGIWLALPIGEILMLLLIVMVLSQRARSSGYRLGLFREPLEAAKLAAALAGESSGQTRAKSAT